MKITIDSAGRIVIPKPIRRLACIKAGAKLEVRVRDGVIEIEPSPAKIRMERKGGFLVAMPTGQQEKLTQETVDETIRSIRSLE